MRRPWDEYRIGTDGFEHLYCEANRLDEWVRQPFNTYSNVAFLIAALLLFRRAARLSPPLQRYALLTRALAFAALGTALGSAFFHASLTRVAQSFDMTFTYGVVLCLGLPATLRLLRGSDFEPRVARGFVVTWAMILVLLFATDAFVHGLWLFPFLIVLVGALATADQKRSRELALVPVMRGASLMVIAGICWILDRSQLLCDPHLMPWGHAIWHLLTAAAIVEFHHGLFGASLRRRTDTSGGSR